MKPVAAAATMLTPTCFQRIATTRYSGLPPFVKEKTTISSGVSIKIRLSWPGLCKLSEKRRLDSLVFRGG